MTPSEEFVQVRTRTRHRTVDRIAAILESAARTRGGITLSALAKGIGAPVSSIQSLVNGLVAAGYLDERERKYTLGSAPYLLNRLAGRRPVSAVTHADLEELHRRTELTTVLSIAVGSDIFYVDYCSTDPRFAYLAENYIRRSLIRTSGGWVLLAGMDERDLWAYLRELPPGEQWLADSFFAALPEIEKSGICAAPRASEEGDGVSIAIRENGKTVAAVGVIASRSVIAQERDRLIELLRDASHGWGRGGDDS